MSDFEIGQRVKMPGWPECQAVVVGIRENIHEGAAVTLRYLNNDAMAVDATVPHGELLDANVAPITERTPQIDIAALRDVASKIAATRRGKGKWVHVPTPKRKPARKSKSKRKRK